MDKEATLEAVEKTIEVVEEQVDTVKRMTPGRLNLNGTTKKQQITILVVTAVVSAAAGGGLTYLVAKKKLQAKYEKIAEQEIAEAKKFYSALNKTGEFSTPEGALNALSVKNNPSAPAGEEDIVVEGAVQALRIYAGEVNPPAETEEELIEEAESSLEQVEGRVVEVVKKNIFQDSSPAEDDFDLDEELPNRSKGRPYVLHHDEFYLGEHDYEQLTLTYYEGDDVLTDEREKPIDDTESLVGNANLLRFGHGSKDKNVVYVRNERLEVDIEIVRNEGEYTKDVLGFIEHSDRRGQAQRENYGRRNGNRRFRDDDG